MHLIRPLGCIAARASRTGPPAPLRRIIAAVVVSVTLVVIVVMVIVIGLVCPDRRIGLVVVLRGHRVDAAAKRTTQYGQILAGCDLDLGTIAGDLDQATDDPCRGHDLVTNLRRIALDLTGTKLLALRTQPQEVHTEEQEDDDQESRTPARALRRRCCSKERRCAVR